MNHSDIEQIYNRTFAGLTLFYRDTDLSNDLLSKYSPGQIIHEPGFVDMSYKGSGLTGNTRYLIASANGRDISAFYPGPDSPGHILLTAGSYFKVLDISESEGKTQVFLLEIPADTVDFFSESTSNIEEEIIEKAKENFSSKIQSAPAPELMNPEWKTRTSSPIGMNDHGALFPIETARQPKEPDQPGKSKPWWKIW